MGKAVFTLKKISMWVLTAVFALSLANCSRRLPEDLQAGGDLGFAYCDGTLGSFDVYVVRTEQDFTMFELYVIPVDLTDPGDIGSITIANQTPSYRTLVREVVFNPGEEILAGYLTETDLMTFDILALTLYDGSGATFLEQNSEKDAICTLPLPGEGTDGYAGYYVTSSNKKYRGGMSVRRARSSLKRSR